MKNKKLKQNKRGFSEVIGMIVMIALTLVAITTVFYAVKSMTQKTLLSPQTCYSLQTENSMSIDKACFNNNTFELEIKFSKKDSSSIEELDFLVNFLDKTETYSCGKCQSCEIISEGARTYYISLNNSENLVSEIPNKVSLRVSGCNLGGKNIVEC